MNLQNNIDPACHADTLRDMAKVFMTIDSDERVDTCLAGADALEALDRVHNVLSSIARVKSDSEDARDRGDDNAEWHETTADALEYVIDLLTEALE